MIELLNNADKSNIVFATIREYKSGENDISILIFTKVCQLIIQKKAQFDHIDTQDIYDNTKECFDFYNAFIKEHNLELPLIPSEHYDLVVEMCNKAIKEEIND